MPSGVFDGILFAKDEPQIWIDDGNFHVAYTVGGIHVEFVLPPRTYLSALRLANEVAAKWQVGQLDNVRNIGAH